MELASELRYGEPMVDEHTLVLVLSQSGETADTIAALKECRERGATIIGIVNVVGSTIAKLADHTLYTWAGPEIPHSLPCCICSRSMRRRSWGACRKPSIPLWYAL